MVPDQREDANGQFLPKDDHATQLRVVQHRLVAAEQPAFDDGYDNGPEAAFESDLFGLLGQLGCQLFIVSTLAEI